MGATQWRLNIVLEVWEAFAPLTGRGGRRTFRLVAQPASQPALTESPAPPAWGAEELRSIRQRITAGEARVRPRRHRRGHHRRRCCSRCGGTRVEGLGARGAGLGLRDELALESLDPRRRSLPRAVRSLGWSSRRSKSATVCTAWPHTSCVRLALCSRPTKATAWVRGACGRGCSSTMRCAFFGGRAIVISTPSARERWSLCWAKRACAARSGTRTRSRTTLV